MAQSWTKEEYEITDAAYQRALERKGLGQSVTRQEILKECKNGLPERDPASIGAHLGNLTSARQEIGLPTLTEVAPFANRPVKLVNFLRVKYRLS